MKIKRLLAGFLSFALICTTLFTIAPIVKVYGESIVGQTNTISMGYSHSAVIKDDNSL